MHLLEKIRGRGKEYSLVSRGRVVRIVAKIKNRSESRSFANLILTNPGICSLFSLQWTQISLLEEASLPGLFSIALEGDDPQTVLGREAKKGAEHGTFAIEKILEGAKPRLTTQLESFVKKLESSGVKIEALDQETFVFHFLRALGLLSAGSPLRAMISLLKPYEDHIADDLSEVALSFLNATKSGFLTYAVARRATVMKACGLDEETYERCIAALVEDGYARPLLSIAWCERHKELPTSTYLVGQRALPRMKCDVCNHGLSHGCLYVLSSAAMTVARQYEGVMPYLIGLNLEQREVAWNAEIFIQGQNEDVEKDILYQLPDGNLVVVECKAFATDVPARTIKSNLASSFDQLSKQVASLQRVGAKVKHSVLATNYTLDASFEQHVKSLLEKPSNAPLRKTQFKVVGPGGIGLLPGFKTEKT